MKWYLYALKNSFVFKGNASSEEFWKFQYWHLFFVVLFLYLDYNRLESYRLTQANVFYILMFSLLYNLLVASSIVAITLRRLKSCNKHWSLVFLRLVPVLGSTLLVYLLSIKSTDGPHKNYPSPPSIFNVKKDHYIIGATFFLIIYIYVFDTIVDFFVSDYVNVQFLQDLGSATFFTILPLILVFFINSKAIKYKMHFGVGAFMMYSYISCFFSIISSL